jgi:TRAP transporter TAXI family solute receptor
MQTDNWAARIGALSSIVVGFVVALSLTAAQAQSPSFFRIGTGGTAGTYYPIGGLIANAISNPPGSRACNEGGSCGVPGLVATAVASNGSVANINGITSGSMESGFTQSDVAYWAYTGTGTYEGKPKVAGLRLIANLYPESIHLVAR